MVLFEDVTADRRLVGKLNFVIVLLLYCGKMDRSTWMGNLPRSLHEVPLTWLAIPALNNETGSHDSFSYTIKSDSDIGPDERRLQCFEHCLCFSKEVKRVIYHWSLTQKLTCTEQLLDGIRYFDFRLAAKLGTLTPFIIHGMYGSSAIEMLEEIYRFLSQHPTEIVLLDFQHFYNFTEEMHAHLIANVKRIFGSMLCSYLPPEAQEQLHLRSLWHHKYQVIVFYRNYYSEKSHYVWPGSSIPNPWPDTDSASRMIKLLDQEYSAGRNPNLFFVTQGVLTPDFTYILFHIFSNLENSLSPKANRALVDWLKDKSAGKAAINIVISDFVGSPPFRFSAEVINLNYKLAQTIERERERLIAETTYVYHLNEVYV